MKKNNFKKILKIYGLIGKVLCACAGGIVGFVLFGSLAVLPAIVISALLAHFIEKGLLTTFEPRKT